MKSTNVEIDTVSTYLRKVTNAVFAANVIQLLANRHGMYSISKDGYIFQTHNNCSHWNICVDMCWHCLQTCPKRINKIPPCNRRNTFTSHAIRKSLFCGSCWCYCKYSPQAKTTKLCVNILFFTNLKSVRACITWFAWTLIKTASLRKLLIRKYSSCYVILKGEQDSDFVLHEHFKFASQNSSNLISRASHFAHT